MKPVHESREEVKPGNHNEQMKTYHIAADGFSRIRIRSYNHGLSISCEEQGYLDRFTKEQVRRAEEVGGLFYDSDMVGVKIDSICPENDTIVFDAQRIRYSQHAGLFRNNAAAPVQALYVEAITVTSDERLVFGLAQATEKAFMGKLSTPAGGVEIAPDGFPSVGGHLYRELSEELGISPDYHIMNENVVPGWVNGASKREGTYHLAFTFFVPLRLTEYELTQWFADWKNAQNRLNKKTELGELFFIPNVPARVLRLLEESDNEKGRKVQGKDSDEVEEWATTYACDLEKLKASKTGARIYLPQPVIS